MLEIELGTELGGNWRIYFNVEKNFREKFILLNYFCVILASAPMMLVGSKVNEISFNYTLP